MQILTKKKMTENEEFYKTTIVDQRQELMVDHTSSNANKNPILRTSYFLKPSLNPNETPPPSPPKIQSFSVSSKPKVTFYSSSRPAEGWKTWVEKLEPIHGQAWRKAGIFDAIKGSTYRIGRDTELIFKLAERWCPETNTFVFPWGEATVTLEDVYVLGGFSPLGVSVSRSCSSEKAKRVETRLIKSHEKLMIIDKNLHHVRWLEHFMGCGDEIELAGFLSLWLARHVFPTRSPTVVTKSVFSLASRVSCGVKVALAQLVLASIYRDLTLLNRMIVDCANGVSVGSSPLKLLSPIHLVQVWAWERFPSLESVPRTIICGETRLARWDQFDRIAGSDRCLDSTRETFRWRPYTVSLENWSFPKFYFDLGKWVVLDCDENQNIIARCVMVCKLLGLDYVEWYNPHRVALQFGFDQDIPKFIDRSEAGCILTCVGNMKDPQGLKLYIPPRLHKGDVTHRYSNWWKTQLNLQEKVLVGCKRKRTSNQVLKMSKNEFRTRDKAETLRVKPVKKSSPRKESSFQNLLQVSNDAGMTSVLETQSELNLQDDTTLEEDEENEVKNPTDESIRLSRLEQQAYALLAANLTFTRR